MGSETVTLGQAFADIPASELYPVLIGFIIGSLIAAFFSFRLFKLILVIMGASAGFSFGYVTLGMLISDRISAFDASIIIGIACAVIFAILAPKFYKVLIYLIGGLAGFGMGLGLFTGILYSMGYETAGDILGVVVGLILVVPVAKLLYRWFKPYLIFMTSLSGSLLAMIFTSLLIFGDNEAAITVFAILGVVLAILAMIVQFRMNRDRELDL